MDNHGISITVLIENNVNREGLMAEHGLSFWIETENGTLLWDTGQSGLLLANAQKLGIDLTQTDHIVISHGHYDHTGGLLDVLSQTSHARVSGHPGMFVERFSCNNKISHSLNSIGMPFPEHILRQRCSSLTLSYEPEPILPGVFTTGEIPRKTNFEDTGGDFFLDMGCTIPDPIIDDQALYIQSAQGLIVILGCAHSGVVNTIDYISKLTSQHEIFAVFGGMHLFGASHKRLEATADAFARYNIRMIGPCHCTGLKAVAYIRSRFSDSFRKCSTGSHFAF